MPNRVLTFEQICEIERRLAQLYRQAKAVRDNRRKRSFCANHQWYGCSPSGCPACHGGLKHQVGKCVGWFADKPELQTEEAYNIGYQTVYGVLPPCRNCICF